MGMNQRRKPGPAIPITGTHVDTQETVKFDSLMAARKAGFDAGAISRCLAGERHLHKKHIWERQQ